MSVPLRITGVVNYRRFVVDTIISALRSVFDTDYNRERMFQGLRVVDKFPLSKTDYPAIVVEFVDRRVSNAGVGHEEWFPDITGVLRKWHHSRFEGSINLDIHARSTTDRDLLSDALVEILRFGRLDQQLLKFFLGVYPGAYYGATGVLFLTNQLIINTDEVDGRGNSATLAPWAPEDTLIFSTGYTLETHGGFYNAPLTDVYTYVQSLQLFPYAQGEDEVAVLYTPTYGWGNSPWGTSPWGSQRDSAFALSNPKNYLDAGVVTGAGVLAFEEHPLSYTDLGGVVSYGHIWYS